MFRRRWFRFHLSTLVLLMFMAGGLMWLNFRPRQKWVAYRVELPLWDGSIEIWGRRPSAVFQAQRVNRYGWPLTCCTESHDIHEFTEAESSYDLTPQQVKELEQLPMDLECDLEYLRNAAPSLMDRVSFELELDGDKRTKRKHYYVWDGSWKPFAVNLLVAVKILMVVGLCCEWVAHRRAKAKDASAAS
jgi:hypothetical protein